MERHFVKTPWLAPALAVLLVAMLQVGAFGQSVAINGVPLMTSRSPVNIGGNLLLPMRDVFEALQSEVKWFASEQKVMAIRGQTTIELWLGRRTATINGMAMQLPEAPMLIGGSTYVPLRFPAEAFGGAVRWEAATRTAYIDIPPLGDDGGLPTTPTTPTTPPPPAPTMIEGTLLQTIINPPTLVLSVSGTGQAQAISLSPTTMYTRHADGQPAQTARLEDAVSGDYAQVTLGPTGAATLVDLAFGEREGVIAGISENSVLLRDNTVMQLSPTVLVKDASGQAVALSSLPIGTTVLLRYQPASRRVWEIRLPTGAPAPPQPPVGEPPRILVVGILNDSPILRGGQTLAVQLQGTPGGIATVDVGRGPNRLLTDLPLTEVNPGIYQGEWDIPPRADTRATVPLMGRLTVGGVQAPAVQSTTRVMIDSTPPEITDVTPTPDTTVDNDRPTIEVRFDDLRGSEINPASVELTINDRRVRRDRDLDITTRRLTYVPDSLRLGRTRVSVSLEDMAGNQAERVWYFTVGTGTGTAGGGGVITSATFAPRGTLVTGDVLIVTMTVANQGGHASFDVGARRGLPMYRATGLGNYRGEWTVPVGARQNDVPVVIHYTDPDGRVGDLEIGQVDINASISPTTLEITAPADGSTAGETIRVFGQAPPGARVRVTITYRIRVITTVTGQLWQGVVNVGPDAEWRTPEVDSSTLFGRANEYVIVAELLSPTNTVLATRQVRQVK